MKHITTDELKRKLKEEEVELIRLLDEEEYQRCEQRDFLNKLKQKQVLSREKIKQDTQELESDNQVGELVVGVSSMIKTEPRIKKEKNKAEKEQKWDEEREEELARETYRKAREEKQDENEDKYY